MLLLISEAMSTHTTSMLERIPKTSHSLQEAYGLGSVHSILHIKLFETHHTYYFTYMGYSS